MTDSPDLNAIADFMLRALHDGYGASAERELRFNAPLAPEYDVEMHSGRLRRPDYGLCAALPRTTAACPNRRRPSRGRSCCRRARAG